MSKKTSKTKTEVFNDEEESRLTAILSEMNFDNYTDVVTVGTLSALYISKYSEAPEYNKIRNFMEHIKIKPGITLETDFFDSFPNDGACGRDAGDICKKSTSTYYLSDINLLR